MAFDYGLTVDKEGFNASMEEARQKARNARNKVNFFVTINKLTMKVLFVIKVFFVYFWLRDVVLNRLSSFYDTVLFDFIHVF